MISLAIELLVIFTIIAIFCVGLWTIGRALINSMRRKDKA